MKALVIGGSYFIGRALVEAWVAKGHEVTVLNRGSRAVDGTLQLRADRNDETAVVRALAGREFDCVVDTSCVSGEQARIATESLAARVGRWILRSSASLYSDRSSAPFEESAPLGPTRHWGEYGLGKLAAEETLCAWSERSGTVAVSLRPPYLYGPGNDCGREDWIWARLLRGRPILLPNAGETPIQFLHTADWVRAVEAACRASSATGFSAFNVADSRSRSFAAWVGLLAATAGVEADLREVDYVARGLLPRQFFPFRDYPCVLDVSRARAELGFESALDPETGFRQTFLSYDRDALASRPIDTRVEDQILEDTR